MQVKSNVSHYEESGFGMIEFEYARNQKPESKGEIFAVDRKGYVSLKKPVDREDVKEYTFSVIVGDGLGSMTLLILII